MKNNDTRIIDKRIQTFINYLLMMKFTILLLLISFQSVAFNSTAQDKIDLNIKNTPIVHVLQSIEQQGKYRFVYKNDIIPERTRVSVNVKNADFDMVMNKVLNNTLLTYQKLNNGLVAIVKKAPQRIPVRGVIRDSTGNPLPNVSIVEKGTTNGTISEIDGSFTLEVADANATLIFSHVNYTTQEILVGQNTVLSIVLEAIESEEEEVVVVGYGTQQKSNVTGAISTIQADDIVTTTSSSLAQSIQGKIPGLQIRQQSSEPGSFSSTINIRGFGEPLYVIDGIVRDGGVEFQQLNPNDIESISILKDASAAIYGLNAANGVILVTTKKGKTGKPTFSYSGVVGWQVPTHVPKMSTASQYYDMYNDAIFFRDGKPFLTNEELAKWREGGEGYESTNWYDETFKKSAFQQQHNFSVRGGNEAVNYFVSLGYYDENGLFKSNDMKYNRYNFRTNITAKITKDLTADVMLSGRYSIRDYPGGDGFIWIYKGTIISHPYDKPYINNDPQYPANIYNQQNAVLMSQNRYAGYTNDRNKSFQSSVSLNYKFPFIKGLEAKGTAAYDSYNMFNKKVWKNYRVYSQDLTSQIVNPPRIVNAIDDVDRVVLQGQLDYKHRFNSVHNLGATLVAEQKYYNKKYSYLKREYDFYTIDVVDYASGLQTNSGSEDEQATVSYIGRVNYDYLRKYLLEASFRYDGSYRYAPGKRWAFFPNASLGWRISEEGFIKNNLQFVDDLKLRASYGAIGENVGDPFQHVLGFTPVTNHGAEFNNGSYTGGMAAPGVINENFTWVKSVIFDVGIDAGFFDNKLSFTVDYYQREKTGKLKTRSGGLPDTFGGDMPIENLDSEQTRGFDFVVSHKNRINDFRYGASFNFNIARTMHRFIDRPESRSSYHNWSSNYTNRWDDFVWGWTRTGQFQNFDEIYNAPVHGGDLGNTQLLPGDYVFEDVNGDGVIDNKDMLPNLRNRTPKMFFGMVLDAAWKNFDMNMVWQGASMYSVRFNEVFSLMFFNNGNLPDYFHDRWRLSEPGNMDSEWIPGKWPASRFSEYMQSSYRESDIWRMDAKYVRLKSIEVGYTLPVNKVRNNFINSMRVYVNAHNLLTISDPFLKQFDPEKYEGDYFAGYNYPLMKSFNVGLNLSF